MKTFLGWVWFAIVQLIMASWTVVGWFLLIPPCLAQAWTHRQGNGGWFSIADETRPIDVWSWWPLNLIYSNPEDGVSGQHALVWTDGVLGPYMPNAWAPWRAYCWSAWRNSADHLKYLFAWEDGPQALWRGHKLGWWMENGYKVPVL